MSTAWNKSTKQWMGRINKAYAPTGADWLIDPLMNGGKPMVQAILDGEVNPRYCKVITGKVYPMTENEIAGAQAIAERARQDAKSDTQKTAENEYLALLDAISDPTTLAAMGLSEVPRSYSDGLGDYILVLSDALATTGDLIAYNSLNAATQRLAWLGNKGVIVEDIPEGGHDMGV